VAGTLTNLSDSRRLGLCAEHGFCWLADDVHYRTGAQRLGRLRQHAISKACALWFIVLIVLPFTAPFATFQLNHSSNANPCDALPKDLKDKVGSDDKLALPSSWSVVPRPLTVVIVGSLPPLNQPKEHLPQHTVLRL
jgi:hypothetical protein